MDKMEMTARFLRDLVDFLLSTKEEHDYQNVL